MKKNILLSKVLRIDFIIIVLSLSSACMVFEKTNPPRQYIYYSDELTDIVLYLRSNAEEGSRILGKPRERYQNIYTILFDMNIRSWTPNTNASYNAIIQEIRGWPPHYVIYQKNYFNDKSIDDLILNYPDLHQLLNNEKYILFRFID